MSFLISTNTAAINAQRYIGKNSKQVDQSTAQLASGSSIVRAADNAAGLSISEGMRGQVRGLNQAKRNANDAMSVVQTAEGGLAEISNILVRINELGVQAASDSVGDTERGFLNKEVQQLKAEVERISQATKYGNVQLLNGSGMQFDFQVDTDSGSNGRISFNTKKIAATAGDIGISDLDFSDKNRARSALGSIENSQRKVSGIRADLGGIQNRLTSSSDNLSVISSNLDSSNSQIRDTDIAASTATKAQSEIMLNASIAMMSQANQNPKLALKLL